MKWVKALLWIYYGIKSVIRKMLISGSEVTKAVGELGKLGLLAAPPTINLVFPFTPVLWGTRRGLKGKSIFPPRVSLNSG